MKPRPIDYAQPDTIDEALALLAEYGDDARVLAGGQTLIAMLNLRLLEPAILIDITRIAELDAIREIDGSIEVGAAVTQNKLMAWPALAEKLSLVAGALPFVGHFQTRNKGTVCGSIAHADPAAELPLTLAMLEGEVVLHSRRGRRVLPARDFQRGMLATARAGRADHGGSFSRCARRRGLPRSRAPARGFRRRRDRRARGRRPHSRRRCRRGGSSRGCAHRNERRLRHHRFGRAARARARRLRRHPRVGTHAPRHPAPARSAGHRRGDAMRRVNKDERARVTLTLNSRKVSGEAEPRMLLSDFLRHVLGLTGTHVGCEHGVCGCCTVLIDGTAVRSCLTLAVQAEGRAVTTVEALAARDGALNPLQQAFQNNHALQCGFCTPGILISFTDFLARNPKPSEAEVVDVLSGHLCRCTGYAGIVAAVLEAAGRGHKVE